jgi:hypothetical protein
MLGINCSFKMGIRRKRCLKLVDTCHPRCLEDHCRRITSLGSAGTTQQDPAQKKKKEKRVEWEFVTKASEGTSLT